MSLVRGKVNTGSFHKERTGESGSCQGPASAMVCTARVIDVENHIGDASLVGFEAHKYVPFVTIAERVQIGMNFGAGAMWVKGTAEKNIIKTLAISQRTIDTRTVPYRADEIVSQSRTVESVPFRDVSKDILGFTTIPSGRIEAVVGIIVTEHLKVKVSSGLNFPTQHRVAVGATFLF
ncbi:MAG: hypothetical protein HY505_00215 [Candidatus Yanofskybacteria bacterium]|nr:hypothetical protein [Candidatus Yanofskybacteria bacterium]